VGAAEGGEEVVEGVFVGEVDGGEAEAPLVLVAVEEIVLANGGVEEVAGLGYFGNRFANGRNFDL